MMIPQISFPKKNQETKNSSTLLGACLQRHPRTTPTKMIPVFTVFTWKNCFGKDSGYAPPTCWKHILSDHHLDTQKIHSCAGAAIDGRQIVGICGEIFGDFVWTRKIQVGRHQWWQSKWHDLGKIEIGGWCYVNTCMIYLVEIKKCANAKIPGHFEDIFPKSQPQLNDYRPLWSLYAPPKNCGCCLKWEASTFQTLDVLVTKTTRLFFQDRPPLVINGVLTAENMTMQRVSRNSSSFSTSLPWFHMDALRRLRHKCPQGHKTISCKSSFGFAPL